jgi:hypothetical protein
MEGRINITADFTVLKFNINSGASDASPTWTDVLAATANYELRLCSTGAGSGSIASASWPSILKPTSGTAVIPEMYAYLGSDASGGLKVTTYDATSAHYMQFRVNGDNTGTYASAPLFSAWATTGLPAASPGTQPGVGDGTSFINGHATDTSSTSYIKANFYGQGLTSGGVQQTPASNAAGTLTVTSGTAGAATPGSAAWLATWQSLQAATQFIQNGGIPQAVTANLWYGVFAFYTGVNMVGGVLLPQVAYQYTWV